MKIIDYQIDNTKLIIQRSDTIKIIDDFTENDLTFVLFEVLKFAKELNDITKEKKCLIELLNLKFKHESLDKLRIKCLEEDVISPVFILEDSDYLGISLDIQTHSYKTKVKSKKIINELNEFGTIIYNQDN